MSKLVLRGCSYAVMQENRMNQVCMMSRRASFRMAPTCVERHVFYPAAKPAERKVRVTHFSSSPPNNERKQADETSKEQLMDHLLHQLRAPPNIITTARIFSSPILAYLIISDHFDWALYGCFAAGCSDVLDGFLAKRYNMGTVLGTYLDPLADKILINVLSVSLWYVDILPTPLIALWLGRDIILVGATYIFVRSETKSRDFVIDPVTVPLKVEPTTISKVNTAFQFLTLGVGLLQPVYSAMVPPGTLETLCWVTGGTTVVSLLSYVGGASLTASGNKVRETVRKEMVTNVKKQAEALRDRTTQQAKALRDRATRRRQK